MKLWRWLESNQYYQITKIQKIITTNLFSLMCLIMVGGRCRTGGKRSSAPNAIRKKNTPCTFTGWRVERNLIIYN